MTMKYFKEGLNKEQLTYEYRVLAKKYHPDLNLVKDTTRIMQEINKEYDEYYTRHINQSFGYDIDDIKNAYEEAKHRRETVLVYLRRDKTREGKFFATNYYGEIITDDSDTWKDFRGGFALCKMTYKEREIISGEYMYEMWRYDQKISRISAKIETPTYADMYFGMICNHINSVGLINNLPIDTHPILYS